MFTVVVIIDNLLLFFYSTVCEIFGVIVVILLLYVLLVLFIYDGRQCAQRRTKRNKYRKRQKKCIEMAVQTPNALFPSKSHER